MSFSSLIPDAPLGPIITAIALLAIVQTLSLLFLLPNWRREHTLRRGILLFLVSAVIYASEVEIGISLWLRPSSTGAMTGLLEVLLGAYVIGLSRAWQLLGAPIASVVGNFLRTARHRSTTERHDDH